MKRIAACIIAAMAIVSIFTSGNANAATSHAPTMTYHKAVHGNLYVELSNGNSWVLAPCVTEDSNNCWWNARKRGNHRGTSYATIRNVVHYFDGETLVLQR